MASLPRIITVDPSGNIKNQISAATDLMDRYVAQIDVPNANYALEEVEIQKGNINAVIAAWEAGEMQGWELAAKIKQIDEDVAIILLGDYDDTELDEDMLAQSPFVYLKRPFDIPMFIRVLEAALDGKDVRAAMSQSKKATGIIPQINDFGPIPTIDIDRAQTIMQRVMTDLNPIAAIFSTRDGEVLFAQGATESLEIDEISGISRKSVISNLELRDMIGSNAQALVFYDGDDYDIFILSVGLHHFMSVVFPGKDGARQLGAVSRFGRRHAEDLIGVLGANAWIMQRSVSAVEEKPEVVRKSAATRRSTQEVEVVPELVRASIGGSSDAPAAEEEEEDSVIPQLEAIPEDEFDADALFSGDFGDSDADDIFSLDALESLSADKGKKGTLDWDRAIELGILDD